MCIYTLTHKCTQTHTHTHTHRWLYWTDTATKTIERAAITGDGREVIRQEPQDSCVYPLLLEYITHTIYWIDTCAFFLKSVRMDGSLSSNEVNIARNIQRSTGMTLLHDSLYWTEPLDIYTTNITTGTPVHHLFQSTQFQSLGGIEVVHPDKQPNGRNLRSCNVNRGKLSILNYTHRVPLLSAKR